MDRVAEPLPALASTTSVPAFWILSVILAASSSLNSTLGVAYRDQQDLNMTQQATEGQPSKGCMKRYNVFAGGHET